MKKSRNSICLFAGNFLFALITLSSPLMAQYTHPIMATVGGTGAAGFLGDGGPATAAQFDNPQGIAVNNSGDVFIADELNNRIRRVHAGIISTVAGCSGIDSFAGDGGAATAAYLNAPFGIAVDGAGNLYIADNQNFRVRKVNTSGIITTIAGTGVSGNTGDGFDATAAKISYVQGMGIDLAGNLYISDDGNHVVRKISTAGIITKFAGNGVSGFSGDGGPATAAQLGTTRGIKADAAGNIYIADNGNNRVRMVNPAGVISTFAGCSGSCLGGPATATAYNGPEDMAIDAAGNIYIAAGDTIFKVDLSGMMSYFAGGGMHDTIPFNDCSATIYGLAGTPYGASFMAMNNHNELFCAITGLQMVVNISNNRPPQFVHGRNLNLTMCPGPAFLQLDSLLAMIDSDRSQWEYWTLLTPPVSGTTTINYRTASSGDTTFSVGAFYFPAPGFIGVDSFVIKIYDCVGAADTAVVHINIPNCALAVSRQTIGYGPGIRVYPNPCSGTFNCHIITTDNQDAAILIYDVLGRQVKKIKVSANKEQTVKTDMPPGVYLLSARTTEGIYNTTIAIR